uniref:Potassium/proton antiporter CemA n=1 Tax=Ankyra judayi TaxID=52688 RepID=A0A140HAW6_9CHLO|nr:chloroplast envelope membrane protein [Ankyra judayi]AMO01315.1 chloroplast envelope membrane protein [Ankyra judayi]
MSKVNPDDFSKLNKKELNKSNLINTTSMSNDISTQNKLKMGEMNKQQVLSITYEEIGLFPRSFNRVFDRFFKQLFSDVENLVIQEYRFYRYLFLTTIKCLALLIIVPFIVNLISKTYFVRPITEFYWNSKQPEIFLNSYQQEHAFAELHEFEEKIYFESLILPSPDTTKYEFLSDQKNNSQNSVAFINNQYSDVTLDSVIIENNERQNQVELQHEVTSDNNQFTSKKFDLLDKSFFNSMYIEQALQQKMNELAIRYNNQSIECITNFFADLISFFTLCFLFLNLEIQINITKSFLLEVFFGLDDSKKALLILFVTDLLVGYHSPNIWELFFQFIFYHYGLPENETGIFLLVATLPVLLDVLFKYLIFRHLNRASPATVATYHAMIE